jgi:hypothetical protein
MLSCPFENEPLDGIAIARLLFILPMAETDGHEHFCHGLVYLRLTQSSFDQEIVVFDLSYF